MIDYKAPDFTDLPGRRLAPRIYKPLRSNGVHVDVSVVTPYYNTGAQLFLETLVSLQAQSLQNWEWIIVDDGSPDNASVLRLSEIATTDARIKVVRQTNGGTAAARNTGFQHSSGRYICLLDHDDMFEPTYLEKCAWFLDSNSEFAFCNSYSVVFGEQNFLWVTGYERGREFLNANSGPPLSVIRRSAWEDCGGFDASIRVLYEDWDFWLAMAKAGHWGYTIPEFLQWYRKLGSGRYEQILESGYDNKEFAKEMKQKYIGLDNNFPEPARKYSSTFDAIELRPTLKNPLEKNARGRSILFIVPWMVTGGADKVNLDLIEGLTALGNDVTVCATLSTDHRWEHEFSRFTPDIFVLPNFLRVTDYPRFLDYLIQTRQVDTVVIAGSTLGYQFLPYLRAVSPGVAFVDMCHVEEPHWLNGGHPRFAVGYQDVLDLNITTTKNLAGWMEGCGADSQRIRVMYTGVRRSRSANENRFSARTALGIPEDVPVIVFAGRMCEQKRPLMLAEILKLVREQGVAFRALVIGDGELKNQFEKLLDEYQLMSHVQMLGTVAHQQWLEILAASDVLLMPSKYEGISIALLEALAAGVVPVVAKVGGQDEIVSSDVGVLISQSDTELQEYVGAIRRLLTDPSALQQMSNQCKAIAASKLSWDGMIARFLEILDNAHEFRLTSPRNQITPQLGRELATQALESKRLGEAVDWLWNSKPQSTTADAELLTTSAEAQAAAKLAIVLSQTWLGRKLIRNSFLKSFGRYVLRRFGKISLA